MDVLYAWTGCQERALIMFLINTWEAFCSKGAEARSPGHGGYTSYWAGRRAECRAQAGREKNVATNNPITKTLTRSGAALI